MILAPSLTDKVYVIHFTGLYNPEDAAGTEVWHAVWLLFLQLVNSIVVTNLKLMCWFCHVTCIIQNTNVISAKYTPWSNICTFLFYCGFNKGWPISTIFSTQYIDEICNIIIIYLFTSLTYCCHCICIINKLHNSGLARCILTAWQHYMRVAKKNPHNVSALVSDAK